MSDFMQAQASVALNASLPQSAQANRMSMAGHQTTEQVRKSANEFESMFIGQMFQPMFDGLETDGLFGGGNGEQMFRSLLVNEYGKLLTQHGGVGFADAVMRTMLKAQGEATQ